MSEWHVISCEYPPQIGGVGNYVAAVVEGLSAAGHRVHVWCPACANAQPHVTCARCGGRRTVEELYSAWLAIPPGVAAGEVFTPSAELPGMIEPVRFRIALSATA